MSQPLGTPKQFQTGAIFKQCFYISGGKAVVARKRTEAVERRMAVEKVKE
jgi:hypothetical protein